MYYITYLNIKNDGTIVKAARIVRVKEPLKVQKLQTPKPKGSQILVKIQSSGVCHSDVHMWNHPTAV
jgi:D-arabinose 1-dehydrogenase-like Zn-dependent alcohol dehydrogenase